MLKWLDIIGLLLSLAGVIMMARALFITGKQALKTGVSRLAGDGDDQNICLPQVRKLLRESWFARIAMILLIIGFLLQIIGSWPG